MRRARVGGCVLGAWAAWLGACAHHDATPAPSLNAFASALELDLQYLHRIRIDNCSITTLVGNEAPAILLSLNDRRAISASPLPAATGPNPVSLVERRASY